ncbi:LAFE_0A06964g1_1 [Lachancea fermentati]|uniref:LAFE_0A06964g1_1 n=1 Tax=Lachancea fermentati TaxID=4955 RepID=A0A1G4M6Z1_LACFM|nr:LAFE_0A06964g1_1 [Lachancea fermentati]
MEEGPFQHRFYGTPGRRIHYVTGGFAENPVIVLLAGFPQSWYAWRKVIPILCSRFRVVAIDLPGQGDSDRPLDGYDTKTAASTVHDVVKLNTKSQYYLAAHDIGAWVAFTYALLYEDEIINLALLDAGIPGVTLPESHSGEPDKAWRTWHFLFHTIADLPEMLIEGKEQVYLEWFLRNKAANPFSFEESDIKEYLRVFKKPGTVRASLAYYRAVSTSSQQNKELLKSKKIQINMLAISAGNGSIANMAAALADSAPNVVGVVVDDCGHYIPEEKPAELARKLIQHFEY